MSTECPSGPVQRIVGRPCGVLMLVDGAFLPRDRDGCIRPESHAGPHLSNTEDGPYEWETDFACDCEHCQKCEGDYCIVYWPPNALSGPARKTE